MKPEIKKEKIEMDTKPDVTSESESDALPLNQEIDPDESILSHDGVDTLISALEDIYKVLENAQELIVSLLAIACYKC